MDALERRRGECAASHAAAAQAELQAQCGQRGYQRFGQGEINRYRSAEQVAGSQWPKTEDIGVHEQFQREWNRRRILLPGGSLGYERQAQSIASRIAIHIWT